ncbi:hypothetical protein [Endozoicomonas sp. SCSIO W0465]|uniref:hypothetical protein n=1 Tax=Endozoicomonas sp. SCSIO W0465 TaxID=2918516 RepID=UPI002074C09C|nr:hypothetical protein [Endozoicomonas sp. SCSIO W0465]USE34848.1 hypothetical protein MJO57_22355 [Endozoicomonas sp. SCSIO W0465]
MPERGMAGYDEAVKDQPLDRALVTTFPPCAMAKAYRKSESGSFPEAGLPERGMAGHDEAVKDQPLDRDWSPTFPLCHGKGLPKRRKWKPS